MSAKKAAKNSAAKLRPDAPEIAFRVMQEATGEAEKTPPPGQRPKNADAVARGSKGGKKSGAKRAQKLTDEELARASAIAAAARWKKT